MTNLSGSWLRRPLLVVDAERLTARERAIAAHAKKAKPQEALELLRILQTTAGGGTTPPPRRFLDMMRKADPTTLDDPSSYELRCLASACLDAVLARRDAVSLLVLAAMQSIVHVHPSPAAEVTALLSQYGPMGSLPDHDLGDSALGDLKRAYGDAAKAADVPSKLATSEKYIKQLEERLASVDSDRESWRARARVLARSQLLEARDGRSYAQMSTEDVVLHSAVQLFDDTVNARFCVVPQVFLLHALGERGAMPLEVAIARNAVTEEHRSQFRTILDASTNRDLVALVPALLDDPQSKVRSPIRASEMALALFSELLILREGKEAQS